MVETQSIQQKASLASEFEVVDFPPTHRQVLLVSDCQAAKERLLD